MEEIKIGRWIISAGFIETKKENNQDVTYDSDHITSLRSEGTERNCSNCLLHASSHGWLSNTDLLDLQSAILIFLEKNSSLRLLENKINWKGTIQTLYNKFNIRADINSNIGNDLVNYRERENQNQALRVNAHSDNVSTYQLEVCGDRVSRVP